MSSEVERDAVLLWLQHRAPEGTIPTVELFEDYGSWVRELGAPAVANTTAFGRHLRKLGLESHRSATERRWVMSKPDLYKFASRPLEAAIYLSVRMASGYWTKQQICAAYASIVADQRSPRLPDQLVVYALRALARPDVEVEP